MALVMFIGLGIGLLWFGSIPLTVIAVILITALLLHFLIAARYKRHLVTFEIMFLAGFLLLGILAEAVFYNVPAWSGWIWLALSLTVSVLFPVPDPRRITNSEASH